MAYCRGAELSRVVGAAPLLGPAAGEDVSALRREEAALNGDPALVAAVRATLVQATAVFAPWERVATFHLLLTPFSVANGMLTQTLKVLTVYALCAYSIQYDGPAN